MALIKCKECGTEFSDLAPACPKCACPTSAMKEENNISNEFSLIKCKNCGKEFLNKDDNCIYCGSPINIVKENKYCSECGNALNENDSVCNHCGCPIIKMNEIKRCKECGNILDENDTECSKCLTPINTNDITKDYKYDNPKDIKKLYNFKLLNYKNIKFRNSAFIVIILIVFVISISMLTNKNKLVCSYENENTVGAIKYKMTYTFKNGVPKTLNGYQYAKPNDSTIAEGLWSISNKNQTEYNHYDGLSYKATFSERNEIIIRYSIDAEKAPTMFNTIAGLSGIEGIKNNMTKAEIKEIYEDEEFTCK